MSMTYEYMTALRDYLETAYINQPPVMGEVGVFQVGLFQNSPENTPAVISIHPGDFLDDTKPTEEYIDTQRSISSEHGANIRNQLFGGYTEMGGGEHYWLHWSVKLEYFMTQLGYDQEMAQLSNDAICGWLKAKIMAAQPYAINCAVSADHHEVLVRTVIEKVIEREGGGPDTSYIWRNRIYIKGLLHRE
jgi:hypothetical protein